VGHRDAYVDTAQGFVMDVNRDGNPDFAIRTADSSAGVAIHAVHGRASGLPTDSTPIFIPSEPIDPTARISDRLAVHTTGDLNGDGFGDLAISISSSARPPECLILRGSNSGIQIAPVSTIVNCLGVSGIGDFDGDGYGDVSIFSDGAPPRVLFGASDLSSEAVVIAAGSPLMTFRRAGDHDGDGLGDLLVVTSPAPASGSTTTQFSIHRGNAARDLTLTYANIGALEGTTGESYAAADANGDGEGDVIFTLGGLTYAYVSHVSAGTAMGPLQLGTRFDRATTAQSLGDLTGNGFGCFEIGGIAYRGTIGTLDSASLAVLSQSCVLYSPIHVCTTAAIGDLDGDGREDVIEGASVSGIPSLRLGTSTGLGSPIELPLRPISGIVGVSDD
jgi:hypothetical protein